MKEQGERKRLPVSVSAAVLIEDEEHKLLLLQQASESKGFKWGPPAGGMHPFEDPMMTAIRETREEIGVQVQLVNLVGIYTVGRGLDKSGVAFVFRAKIDKGKIKPAGEEIKSYDFFSYQQIRGLIEKDLLYKPEYNIASFRDWARGKSYSLEVVNPLLKNYSLGKSSN